MRQRSSTTKVIVHDAYKSFIKEHHNKLILQIALIPIVPFILVLIETIYWPGPIFCSDTCPRSEPWMSDVGLLTSVVVIYAYIFFLGILILKAAGSWMKNAVRAKLITIFIFILMITSLIQIISSYKQRYLIYPYYQYQQYTIEITPQTETSANLLVSNYYNSAIKDVDYFGIKVFQLNNDEKKKNFEVEDISPFSKIIYKDGYSEANEIKDQSDTIFRLLDNLEINKLYAIEIIPYSKSINRQLYLGDHYFELSHGYTLLSGDVVTKNSLVDIRSVYLCHWQGSLGCVF